MASRNYGMAYDTPYNKRLIEVLERYDAERDTNGEPAIFNNERLEGGSFVGQNGRGIYHPHLYHPILSRGAGDLDGGKFNFGKSIGKVGKTIGKVAMPIAKDLGQYALQQGQKEATRRGRDYIDSYLQGGAMGKPPGMVSPFVHGLPAHMVQSGTMAAYPMYNAVEMRGMGVGSGGACCGERCERCGGNFFKSLGKGLKSVGKVALPIAGDIAKEAAMAYMMGAGVQSGGVGVLKKPRGRPRKMVADMDGGKFNFGKALKSVGKVVAPVAKSVGKVALPIATDMAKEAAMAYMMGAGVHSGGMMVEGKRRRGRPRKMDMDGGKFNFGKALKSVGKVVAPVAKSVGKVALPIATDMAKEAAMAYMMGAGVHSGGKVDGRKRRAEIVRKIMAEKGMKMIDASKYVKANGLY
jgi:uncharacterized metal-binding protein